MCKVLFIIIGALIGAGFASGEEIYVFFYSYGIYGLCGIIISSLLFGTIIYKVLEFIQINNIKDYGEFLENIVSKKINEKVKIKVVIAIKYLTNIFLILTFYVMIAGFGTYLKDNINLPNIIGSLILVILVISILSKNLTGIIRINKLIVPFLIIFILTLSYVILVKGKVSLEINDFGKYLLKQNSINWILSSILYVSYNCLLLIPVLISIRKIIDKNRIGILSILTSIIIFILSICIYLCLIEIDVDISKIEMPIGYIINTKYSFFKIFYGIVILLSILTTSISIVKGLIENLVMKEKNRIGVLLLISFLGVIIAQFGFSKLISYLYPIYGYLGILIILLLILKI